MEGAEEIGECRGDSVILHREGATFSCKVRFGNGKALRSGDGKTLEHGLTRGKEMTDF
jgi:hypothetical protein